MVLPEGISGSFFRERSLVAATRAPPGNDVHSSKEDSGRSGDDDTESDIDQVGDRNQFYADSSSVCADTSETSLADWLVMCPF